MYPRLVADHVKQDKEHCVPKYEAGDYIKVEFPDEATAVAEWMWVRVQNCDDAKQVVFGTLDNAPDFDASH
jgi:GTP-dependent phosphoenolpyruvate carboxykinase